MTQKLYDSNDIMLFHGDIVEVLTDLQSQDIVIDACVTSPPYAEQRKNLYGGVPEDKYPQWTLDWMNALKPMLSETSSCLINIREHIKNCQISDYVLKTRLLLRENKWNETEELIWIKPDSPPVGNMNLPRRSWERILWFSTTSRPYVDAKANGKESNRIGMPKSQTGSGYNQWGGGSDSDEFKSGRSRCKDYVEILVSGNEAHGHPAAYPVALAEWMIKLISKEGDTIVDPFNGSGSTAIACINTGRKYIGIDHSEEYINTTINRITNYTNNPANKPIVNVFDEQC